MLAILQRLAILYFSTTLTRSTNALTLPPPGQPNRKGTPGGFEIIGESLVSAQQIFLGTQNTVYIVDKVEGNPTTINGHPAWASEWTLGTNSQRAMDARTNTFCAAGNVLGNGTWINVGGNQAVTYGGEPADSQVGGGPYDDPDGRTSIRLLTPSDDDSTFDWVLSPLQTDQRWYPTLETLEDGSIIIVGGCRNGGYVNDASQTNPTYEYFPPNGRASDVVQILTTTLPANLYPLIWLLPSGKLLIQSNWATSLWNHKTNEETPLDNIPDAVRTYPASAGTVMLPLTPANNWTATILFCGGSDIQPDEWFSSDPVIPERKASTSCVTITPELSTSYVHTDAMPEARSMSNFIFLPTGQIFNANGAKLGTAGYGNDSWAIGHSYADDPVLTPAIYDPAAPAGKRWSRKGLTASTIPRLYHSSATLLPDGSIMISGSNPNPDYTVGPDVKYPTEYRTELFYPSYFNERRPQPQGLISQITYGGPSFDVQLDANDLFGDVNNVKNATVVIIRTGFSTHGLNMGQRYVQLNSTYTGYESNKTAILHVSQLPPNPSILAPGPAFIFVVVNGIPSLGSQIMVGSGEIGKQQVDTVAPLPDASVMTAETSTGGGSGSANQVSSAGRHSYDFVAWIMTLAFSLRTFYFCS